MRIALFSDTYLPQVNGVSRTLARLVAHAHGRGHEEALFTPRISPDDAPFTALHVQLPGIPLFVYPELRIARPLDRKGVQAVEAFRPDVVHCAVEGPVGWSGRRWALRRGIPLVTSFHTNFPAYLKGYGFGWVEGPVWKVLRRFHRPALRTFCPSADTIRMLQGKGFKGDLRIWSRGVEHELFSPTRRTEEVRQHLAPGADRILVYVGRLAPEKRLSILQEAWPRIRAQAPGRTALVFVGGGPLEAELREWAGEDVYFTGYLSGEKLAQAFAAADVFVFPSDTETFGNVVAEALSSGVPAVVVNSGGVTDMVRTGDTGIVVEPGDPAAFAQGVLTLLSDPGLLEHCSKRARVDALGRSWDQILDGLLEEYEEVSQNVTPPLPSHAGAEPWTS